jgi:hypothetical protein
LGILALIHMLTGEEEEEIFFTDFVWTPHKLTEDLDKTSLKYIGNRHYFGENWFWP